jgi:glycogen debranching enzyme
MKNQIINTCYNLSIENLLKNATEFGLLAASPDTFESKEKDYASLFSRDVVVCCLGMLMSGNEKLITLAKTSLITLLESQSPRGQFPQNYIPEKKQIVWWNPGGIDGTLWWSIAFLTYYKITGDKAFYEKYKDRLEKAFTWLTYQDTNNDFLIEQGEASDWADEFPRMGTVLYSNALWYWLVKLRIEVEQRTDFEHLRERIHEGVNTLLWVHKTQDNLLDYVPQNTYTTNHVYAKNHIEYTNTHAGFLPYYLGFVSHKTFEMRCDVYANILACLVGLADEKKQYLITDSIIRSGIHLPYPIKVMYPALYPGEPDWKPYMAKGRQNYPWQYHNGGIWPYVGGFWVMWLAKYNKKLAGQQLEQLALANKVNNWEFNEFLHGQLGTPIGIPLQSWNMAMFLAAHQAVQGNSIL